MASTILFVVMAILAGILLLVASITATMGAIDAYNSTTYSNSSKTQSAHKYLTIAAALGWSALATLIVILIVAAVAGGFSSTEPTTPKTKPPANKAEAEAELITASQKEKKLSESHTTQIIVLIVLIIIAIIALIVGILGILAAVQLAGVTNRDSRANSAYIEAIIAAVAGVGGIVLMIVAVITYFGITKVREKQLKETEAYVAVTEQQLNITPEQLQAAAKTVR